MEPKRIVVGITGATGAVYGVRVLSRLRALGATSHLVLSGWGARTAQHELGVDARELRAMADVSHAPSDMAASISSGSFHTDGMVVAPCSMRTLASIANGLSDNLVARAADVTLKEGRRLVLMVRETPLSTIHLENMLRLSRMNVTIFPPVPAFYHRPTDLDEVIDHTVTRTLDQLGIVDPAASGRWTGDLVGREAEPTGLAP